MKVEFTVASREPQQVEREIELDGAKHRVLVPAVIVQLLPVKDDGTGTLKVSVDKESLEIFKPGNKVSVEFAAAK
jgi:hypothetical protein